MPPREPPRPYDAPAEPASHVRAGRQLLALALVLGLARGFGLSAFGLWIDEAHTLSDALWYFQRTPQKYPLGYLLTALVVRLRGGAIDEATLRLAPALCGFLVLPLTWWALRPALGARRAAATALLLAVSSWLLFWSQSARAYTLMLCLSVTGGGCVLRGLLQGRRLLLVLGLTLSACAAFAHPSAALLLPAWIAAPLLTPLLGVRLEQSPPLRLLIGLAIVGAGLLGGWAATVWTTYEGVKFGASPVHFLATVGWFMTPLVLLAAAWGALRGWREGRAADVLLASAVVVAAALALAASAFAKVAAQYVLVLLPWTCALATSVLEPRPGRPLRPLAWVGLALLALPSAIDSGLYFAVRHGDRPRWREAYAYVFEHRAAEDLVLGMHGPVGEYYLHPGKTWLRTQDALVRLDEFSFHSGVLERGLRNGRRVWVVLHPEDLAGWSPPARDEFRSLLAQEARLVQSYGVPYTPRNLDVDVYLMP